MVDSTEALQAGPVLLYDGTCGVCSQAVQWILQHERAHSLRFAALESPLGSALREAARVPAQVDSVMWVELRAGGAHAEICSGAILRVLAYVGGPWRWLTVLRFVPRALRDAGYRAFARVRYRVRDRSCLIPTPEERLRFLGARPSVG